MCGMDGTGDRLGLGYSTVQYGCFGTTDLGALRFNADEFPCMRFLGVV